MDTSLKFLIWRLGDNRTASDHFSHLYGIDVYGDFVVYVAVGTEGVIAWEWDAELEFRKRDHLKSLPAPALDVAVSGNKLYVLCGELSLRNVQHNEDLIVN